MDFSFMTHKSLSLPSCSIGHDTNKGNGLALCRVDVNSTECRMCITDALARVRQDYPFKKSAPIWFDECFLRYSENALFGEIDKQESFVVSNTQKVLLSSQATQLMSSLRKEVHPPLFFALEVMDVVGMTEELYRLAQCNRELSSEDCDKCLESLALLLYGKRGRRFVNRNCNVRYELYPFFKL